MPASTERRAFDSVHEAVEYHNIDELSCVEHAMIHPADQDLHENWRHFFQRERASLLILTMNTIALRVSTVEPAGRNGKENQEVSDAKLTKEMGLTLLKYCILSSPLLRSWG